MIETLGPSTSTNDLRVLAEVGGEQQESLDAVRDRVESLKPHLVDSRLHAASSDRDLYTALSAAASTVASFQWDLYARAIAEVGIAQARHAEASKTAFAAEAIPGIFGEAWRNFVVAGEAYVRATGTHDHSTGGPCPYCRQELGPSALALLQKYREYCDNDPKRALDAAKTKLTELAHPIAALQLDAMATSCEQRCATFGDPAGVPDLLTQSIAFLTQVAAARTAAGAGQAIEGGDRLAASARQISADASAMVKKAETTIAALRMRADERQKELVAATAELALLENRVTLRGLLPDVVGYVERAQWAAKATPLISRLTAALRSLTEQSKRASRELLDEDFARLFEAECEALRAPRVRLDFAGRKGQAARKKTLVPDHRLSEILSEGEQKVIALADFLAEAALRRTTAPIIFDDPVNSLDYKRLQHVVDRIVDLCATRQVVVFTHNIWFATALLARTEKTADCTYYNVSENGGTTGYISGGAHPRWDTVAKLSGRINDRLQAARAAAGENRLALVESAYDLIRSWCEVVVEQELLASVVQRYQPNVMMTKLSQIKLDKFASAREVISPLFDKACRIMTAHSQPLETLGVRPSLDELEKDWKAAQDARAAYMR